MRALRQQPPSHSPLSSGAILRGAGALLPGAVDPRPALRESLVGDAGAASGVLTDSGTSALRLALELLREKGRTPVALPAYSCYDVATAAVGAGVPVILYDLDPLTLSPEPESLEEALSRGARALVVAPLFGFPVDWDEVRDRTSRHDATIVEDAAQSHGARWRGEPPGRQGDLVVLSFGRGKGWTGGSGGALLGRSDPWAAGVEAVASRLEPQRRVGETAHLGRAAFQWLLGRPALYGLPSSIPWLGLGETHWQDPHPPREMGPAAARLALATRRTADEEVGVRRDNGNHLRKLFEALRAARDGALDFEPVVGPERGEPGYLRFPVLAPSPSPTRPPEPPGEALELGAVRGYPKPLGDLPALRPLLASDGLELPGAARLAASLLTLPTHSFTTPRDRKRVVKLLASEAPNK